MTSRPSPLSIYWKEKKAYSWGGNVIRKEVRNTSNLSACSES
jgi:hypothetical protein